MALHFGGKCSRLELCNPDQDFSWAQESGEELRPFNFFNKHALNVKLWKTHLVLENYFLKSYCTSILRPSLVIRTDDFQISFSLIFSSKLVNVNKPRTLKTQLRADSISWLKWQESPSVILAQACVHDEENYDRVGFCLSTLFYSICGKGGRHFSCEISCQFRRSTYYARTYSHDLFQQFYFLDLNTKANKSHSKV